MEDRYLQLIHQELDGVNSPEEHAALGAYLEAHPEARQLYDELAALSDRLKGVPMEEAPADLTYRVMTAIARPQKSPAAARSWLPSVLEDLRAWKWRYALSFSAGLAMGFIVLVVALDTTDNTAFLRGVMGLKGDVSGFVDTDAEAITLGSVQGNVHVASSPDFLRIEVQLEAAREVEFRIGYDSTALAFCGMRLSDSEDTSVLRLQAGEIQISRARKGRYLLILRGQTDRLQPLHFLILDGQALLYDGMLQTGRNR